MSNNQDLTGFRNLLGLYYCHAMLPNDCIVWASTPLSHRLIKPRERTRDVERVEACKAGIFQPKASPWVMLRRVARALQGRYRAQSCNVLIAP